MNTTNWIIVGLMLLAVVLGAVAYFKRAPQTQTPTTEERPLKTYYDERYGIAFNFPDNNEVQEHDATGEGVKHHTIVIADKGALANVPQNGEGPPSITIDIFDNPAKDGVEKWIKGSNFSNYKLSPDSTLTAIPVAGKDAIAYAWDGLYRSTSIVFQHRTYIVMMSVGQITPEDQIVKDFAKVVASIQLDP